MLRPILALALVALWFAPAASQDGAEEKLSSNAQRLTGEALVAAFADRRGEGMFFEDHDGRWYFFTEHYKADGVITGEGGPAHDKNKWWWRGTWSIESDLICFDYPDDDTYCREVWLEDDVYKLTTADGHVTEWHRLID